MKRRSFLPLVAVGALSSFLSCADRGTSPPPDQKKVSAVASKVTTADGPVTAWVMLKDRRPPTLTAATRRNWNQLGQEVYAQLTTRASVTQSSLLTWLSERRIEHKSFWIVNAVRITADQDTLAEVARRPEVDRLVPEGTYSLPPVEKTADLPRPRATEWGLENIRAPEVWSTFGIRGENVIVANIDTGVQFDHPALVQKYRGNKGDGTFDHNYNWFDARKVCGALPCDTNGHGTHTMGTMVGDDGNPGPNQIGVAPLARWIATNGCCTVDALMSSFQWLMAPTDLAGQNPSPELRPHVVNNSWGGPHGDPLFQEAVQAWVAAGIFPAFANGNSGPGCGSSNAPGDYPEAYAVGAYDIANNIAPFSSRGPSGFGGVVKPNLSAPGVSVRSSVPGNGYESASGTSMATPHLAGVVALMWSGAPALIGQIDATRALLDSTAVDKDNNSCGGTPENNNVYGEGRLDAFAAVEASPRGPTGTLQGTVTAAGGGPIAGAVVRAEGESTRVVRTDAAGAYSMVLSTGTYRVSASSFGYISQTVEVTVTEGATTVADFALQPAPSFSVSGQVLDPAGNPHVGAKVTVLGTPIPPAITGGDGRYTFASVPAGTYQIRADAGRCFEQETRELVVDGDEVVNFTLAQRKDAFGHSCQHVPAEFIDAGTVLSLVGRGASMDVPLPFPFPLYGATYEVATVSTSGFIAFDGKGSNGPPSVLNGAIPDPALPNAAIYGFWDDLGISRTGSVRTQLLGDAPNRRFVIEWRDAILVSTGRPVRFEIVLHENGRVLLQYAPPGDDPAQRGDGATVGLENDTGTVAFQYSLNEPVLDPATGILFSVPPSGFVEGTVTDGNDGLPIGGAQVRLLQGSTVVRTAKTNSKGRYRVHAPVGSFVVEASAAHYRPEQKPVTVALDQTVTADFVLQTARAVVTPTTLELVVKANQVRTRTLTLKNSGTLPLEFKIDEAGGQRQSIISTARLPRRQNTTPGMWDTRQLFEARPGVEGWTPTAPGKVIRSFPPTGTQLAWGVGYTGQLWLSDPIPLLNWEFTPEGVHTGRKWSTPWATEGAADMAYVPGRKLMCQLAPFVNGIHCWDPATGAIADSITGNFPWTVAAQFGLAYREDDDSFYVGGWEDGTIYHIKGLGHADKGAVIGQCKPADGQISGLAWNGGMGVLWVATNSPTDTIYELNPQDCTVLATLAHPQTGGFQGAGLDIDENGDLWMIGQRPNTVFLVESGVPAFSDVPWLSVAPASGSVAPGGQQALQVTIDTSGLAAGTYLASIFVSSNSGREPRLRVPVSLVVTEYQQGVNAGSSSYTDTLGDPWAADRRHTPGSWGYIQSSPVKTTSHAISGTPDPKLYQSQRIDPYAYRFDAVPNGIYQVELRFAELDKKDPGARIFDVVTENTLVLPAHDISYEVGRFAADNHTFFIEVTDGRMDVRLIPRAGSSKPVINALRITHRPDR
jgi:subtilisin family serine protease